MTVAYGTIYKKGNTFYIPRLAINITTISGSGWQTVGNVPSGYSPSHLVTMPLIDDTSMSSSTGQGASCEARIAPEGDVQIWNPKSSHNYWGGGIAYV